MNLTYTPSVNLAHCGDLYTPPLPEEMTAHERHHARRASERLARQSRYLSRRHRYPTYCLK